MSFHTNVWFLKDKKVIEPRKNLVFEKKPVISFKVELLELAKNCSIDVLFSGLHDAP